MTRPVADDKLAPRHRAKWAMHALNPYDALAEAAQVEALEATAAALPAAPVGDAQAAGRCPIFIAGLPRSGSTLLDHMLSAHSDVVSAGEIGDFQRQLLSRRSPAGAVP